MTSPDSENSPKHPSAFIQPLPEGVVKLPKLVAFSDLCRCGDEVWIENEGKIYRLRRTKLGKLILTK